MKNTLLLLFLGVVVINFGCKDNPTNSEGVGGTVSFTLAKAQAGIVEVIATFSRSGYDSRTLSLAITDSMESASGSLSNIPVGLWHLKVDAFNDAGNVKYTGETDVDVIGGNITRVSLELGATTGGVEILVTWGGPCAPSPAGLVSWWPGNGNGTDAVGGNNGILQDSVMFVKGVVGSSFNFSWRGQYVRIPHSPSLNPPGGSFTLDAWIRPTSDVPHAGIISKWGDRSIWEGQRSWYLGVGFGGSLEFSVCDSSHQEDSTFQIFRSSPGKITLNAWNHVAAVFDQSLYMRSVYVNGEKIGERVDSSFTITQGIADVSIGTFQGSPNFVDYAFPGQIDEVDLFGRALNANEIKSIFLAGSRGKCR